MLAAQSPGGPSLEVGAGRSGAGGVFATSSREGLEEACGEAAGDVVSTAGDSGVGHPQAGSGPLAAVLLPQGSRCGDDSPTAVAAWVACRGQGGGCPAVTLSVLCLPRSGSEQHVDLHRRRGLRSRALESGVGQVQRLPLVPGPGEPGARGAGRGAALWERTHWARGSRP